MRKPGGYSIITDPNAKGPSEEDTFTCKHCGKVVFVKPLCDPAEMGGRCTLGCGLICKGCAQRGGCDPLEEKLLRWEAQGAARRSYEECL